MTGPLVYSLEGMSVIFFLIFYHENPNCQVAKAVMRNYLLKLSKDALHFNNGTFFFLAKIEPPQCCLTRPFPVMENRQNDFLLRSTPLHLSTHSLEENYSHKTPFTR